MVESRLSHQVFRLNVPMFSRSWCGPWFTLQVGPMNGCVDYPLDWTWCFWDAGIGAIIPMTLQYIGQVAWRIDGSIYKH